jgi:hypothetical protein
MAMRNRGRYPCRLGCGKPDEERQAWDIGCAGDGEAVAEEAIERHLEFGAGLEQAQHGVAGGFAWVADGSAEAFADNVGNTKYKQVSSGNSLVNTIVVGYGPPRTHGIEAAVEF